MYRTITIGLFFAIFASCTKLDEQVETYPNRPIEVIVPFAPGGGSDTFARIIKAEIEEQNLLPQPLVIINAPGAGGTIGSRRVMNEKPDGYTVLLLHDGILTAQHSGKALYGPDAFAQVAGTSRSGMVIAVHQDSPYDSLTALLDAAADNPDQVTFAANLGAPSHFIGLIIEQEHGTAKFRFAQSGGGADRFAAIKGEHVDATAFSMDEYLRFRPDGIKALAYLGKERHHEVPELETAIEQGIDVEQSIMQYWWMPKGTPSAHIERFSEVLKQVMESETVKLKLNSRKIDPLYMTGDELDSHLKEVNAALASVDPGTDSPAPNIPIALTGLTILCGVMLVIQRFRAESDQEESSSDQPSFRQWAMVVASALLVIVYATLVVSSDVPLGVTTATFLGAMGFMLSGTSMKKRPWLHCGLVIGASLGTALLFHIVFTKVFEIGL